LGTDWILLSIWFKRLDTKPDFSVAFVTFCFAGLTSPVLAVVHLCDSAVLVPHGRQA